VSLETGHRLDPATIRARYETLAHRGGLGRAFAARVIALAGPPPRGRVADVGCGEGELLSGLAAAWPATSLYGVDFAASRLRAAASLAPSRVRLVDADLGAPLPFRDGVFDVVFCTEVLEHLTDPARCLRELRRVLTPAGRLTLSVPNATGFAPFHRLAPLVPGAWLRGKLLPYEHPANTDQPIDTCWTYGEIVDLVRAGGFEIDAWDGMAYFRYLEMLPILRDVWRPLTPAAERLLPRLGGHRFAYHVLLRCRPADGGATA
jgi:2-polyprenyl-3-methyl-5-hydroxy-6-metoxy-1,4-benzoquinol methylase